MTELNQSAPIGLIAGGGQFPLLFAEAARGRGRRVVAIGHVHETLEALEEKADSLLWVKLGQLGKIIKHFQREGVRETVFAGTITKTRIFRDIFPDLKGLALWNKIDIRQDDAILPAQMAQACGQRIQVGDASTVFWAQKDDAEIEEGFAAIFGERDDPDDRAEQVRALLGAVQSGQFDGGRGDKLFYVLGLAPNAARVSVRFWHAAPLHEIAHQIRQWFADLKVVRSAKDPEFPSLFRLLAACAQQGKADNIPPSLGGDIMRAILSGSPFPATWLNAAVLRCRAEQNVTYLRAAAIKASLNRLQRFQPNQSLDKELSDMLDLENTSPAYRLGRLFAALEKIQEEASPGLNATIRERYYGAASSTPVVVFTTLLRLKNHHLAKLTNRGRAINFERLLGEIMGGLNDFPKHLSLPEQGRFALGYYHQRQDFFSKSESSQSMQSTQGESK